MKREPESQPSTRPGLTAHCIENASIRLNSQLADLHAVDSDAVTKPLLSIAVADEASYRNYLIPHRDRDCTPRMKGLFRQHATY